MLHNLLVKAYYVVHDIYCVVSIDFMIYAVTQSFNVTTVLALVEVC